MKTTLYFLTLETCGRVEIVSRMYEKKEEAMESYAWMSKKHSDLRVCETIYG